MTSSFRGKQIETVDDCKRMLRLLLKEVCDHDCKQLHLDNLRNAIIDEKIVSKASEILEHERIEIERHEHEARERLLD